MKDSVKEKINLDELNWKRVFSSVHIPRTLMDHVQEKECDTTKFLTHLEKSCLEDEKKLTLNPLNHLYVLADSKNLVKGFLWAVIDPISDDLIIKEFSIDKEFWNGKKSLEIVFDHAKNIVKQFKLNKIYWSTHYPKHAEREGFKKCRQYLMEFDPKKEV